MYSNSPPKISICIPTFNRADLLRQTLISVAIQTQKPDEVLIVDNASTDNTEHVVKEFDRFGFTYVRNKTNIGMARNYNRCLSLAKNDFFTFLASDDLLAPTWYQEWIDIISTHKADLYISPITIIDNDNNVIWSLPIFDNSKFIDKRHVREQFNNRFTPGPPPIAMNIFKKSFIQKLGGFNPDEGTEFDVRVMLGLFDICDVYYHHQFIFALREHKYRAFDTHKETKDIQFMNRLENNFMIIQDIWRNKYKQHKRYRSFLHCTLFMNLCNINLYIARLEFNKIAKSYRACFKYFPELFKEPADWMAFIRYQYEFIRRIINMRFVPKQTMIQTAWTKKIQSANLNQI